MNIFCKMFGHHFESVKIALKDDENILDRDPKEEEMINSLQESIKPVFCRSCKQTFKYNKYKRLRK